MKFVSQSASLKLVVEPQKEIHEEREVTLTPGLTLSFVNGVFETNDQDLIKKLKASPSYGREYGPEKAKPKKEPVVAPKLRAPKVIKSPAPEVVQETNPNMTDTADSNPTVAKVSRKSAKLNKEAVIN